MPCIPQKLLKDMVYMYNSCFSSVLYASMLHFGRVRLFYYCKYTKIVGIIYLDKTSNTKKRAFYGSFRSLKSTFCLSTSPEAPCWRFPILAMTMYEQARHCSFGLTKTFEIEIIGYFFLTIHVKFELKPNVARHNIYSLCYI